jgi:hypothetical protein
MGNIVDFEQFGRKGGYDMELSVQGQRLHSG